MKIEILWLLLVSSFLLQLSIYCQSSPENICGEDDRSLSSHPAVGRIWRSNYAHGTAFIISNGKLITAGHVAVAILGSIDIVLGEIDR